MAIQHGNSCVYRIELLQMMKKVIIVNASPRKNMNTAQLLKEAQKGAESVSADLLFYERIE